MDLGGAALLLVRRDGVRRVVRRRWPATSPATSRSARIARGVALAALAPSPAAADHGPRAPGALLQHAADLQAALADVAWARGASPRSATSRRRPVGADLLGRRRAAKALGGANAVVGGYLGSYTGVLLASTAVPVWARSRLFLGPIFVATATATGAAAARLALAAGGPARRATRRAARSARVETGAMTRRARALARSTSAGSAARARARAGAAGQLFRRGEVAVRGSGSALRFARERGAPHVHHLASVLYLVAGLLFRYAWVGAGRASAARRPGGREDGALQAPRPLGRGERPQLGQKPVDLLLGVEWAMPTRMASPSYPRPR